MTPTQKQQDLSASFFRQLWLLKLLQIENEAFLTMAGKNGTHLLMKNTIITIKSNVKACKRLLPNSVAVIDAEINDEKLYAMHQIMEKLTYCTKDQLEWIEDVFTENTIEVKD
jgi:hypothetical protein